MIAPLVVVVVVRALVFATVAIIHRLHSGGTVGGAQMAQYVAGIIASLLMNKQTKAIHSH